MNNKITIFTDGASRGNPGPGGWGAVLIGVKDEKNKDGANAKVIELGGAEKHTTNNRMELTAAIEALKKTPKETEIALYTDSSYLINGITKWIKGWKKIGWMTRAKEEVLNRDLWTELDVLAEGRTIRWQHVGGHIGVAGNERCDEIATTFADGNRIDLFNGALNDYFVQGVLDIEPAGMKK